MDKRTFTFAKVTTWGLLISTGAIAFVGVLAMNIAEFPEALDAFKFVCIVGFALVVLFALCVSQAAAACALYLKGPDYRRSRWGAIGISGVTSTVSLAGGLLGHALVAGHPLAMPPMPAMFCGLLALMFVKPGMAAVIMACEERADGVAGARDIVLEVKDKRINDLEREVSELKKALRDKPEPVARASASASRAVAAALKGQHPTGPSRRAEPQSNERVEADFRTPTLDELKTACEALFRRDTTPSLRLVANECGVPKSRIERALTENKTTLLRVVETLKQAEAA